MCRGRQRFLGKNSGMQPSFAIWCCWTRNCNWNRQQSSPDSPSYTYYVYRPFLSCLTQSSANCSFNLLFLQTFFYVTLSIWWWLLLFLFMHLYISPLKLRWLPCHLRLTFACRRRLLPLYNFKWIASNCAVFNCVPISMARAHISKFGYAATKAPEKEHQKQ